MWLQQVFVGGGRFIQGRFLTGVVSCSLQELFISFTFSDAFDTFYGMVREVGM